MINIITPKIENARLIFRIKSSKILVVLMFFNDLGG